MINKTKDYDQFVFRDDNREKIDQNHIKKLIDSITARNLLEFRPICVNDKMEVIDGQHRLLAAKALGVEIYYQKDKSLSAYDIVRMNLNKAWSMCDYLNFYCNHDYIEYVKLRRFMKKNNMSLNVALNLTAGRQHISIAQFKNGEFVFKEEDISEQIEICWETIAYIKKMNGFSPYTNSGRFWKALLKLVKHPDFDESRWRSNMQKMIEHFTQKARMEDYVLTFSNVYNYRNLSKINFLDN